LLKDIDLAVDRINKAIKNQERMMIFGDYDVDGVSGATILYLGLKELGANISVRLPHREKDGYGLNTRVLDECSQAEVKVVITVDCGISNVKEVEYGKNLGLDIIITDHHSIPPVLPSAYAIINPKQTDCSYPEKEIVGSVVAFKLICALFDQNLKAKTYLPSFLDLAALATVADCAPLRGENRLIVKQGLLQFANTQHRGLRKLAESYELLPPLTQNPQPSTLNYKPLSSYHLGFLIAPCINAAGRLEDPMIAFKMMIGDTEKAMELRQMNLDRQEIVRTALQEAMEQVEKHHQNDPILIFWAENWQPGIIGLLAGRLCEKYYRPVICLTRHEEKYVGSCRSIPEINIVEKLQAHEDLFLNYGGHAQAAGLSISPGKLEELRTRLIDEVQKQIDEKPIQPYLSLDTEIMENEIDLETVESIKSLEPFGMGNPTPKFLFKNIEIKQVRAVGQDKTHLQFGFQHRGRPFKGIAFQFAEHEAKIKEWDTVDIACQLNRNEFRGNVTVDLQVVDMRKSL
jgi:single-stranded-DNA-specific exonuclease